MVKIVRFQRHRSEKGLSRAVVAHVADVMRGWLLGWKQCTAAYSFQQPLAGLVLVSIMEVGLVFP